MRFFDGFEKILFPNQNKDLIKNIALDLNSEKKIFLTDGSYFEVDKPLIIEAKANPKPEDLLNEKLYNRDQGREVYIDALRRKLGDFINKLEINKPDIEKLIKIFDNILSRNSYHYLSSDEKLDNDRNEKYFVFSEYKSLPEIKLGENYNQLESFSLDAFTKFSTPSNMRLTAKSLFYLNTLSNGFHDVDTAKLLQAYKKSSDHLSNLLLSEFILNKINKFADDDIEQLLNIMMQKNQLSSNLGKAIRFYKPQLATKFFEEHMNAYPSLGDISLTELTTNKEHYRKLAKNDLLDENFYFGADEIPLLERGSVGIEAEMLLNKEEYDVVNNQAITLGRDIKGIPEYRTNLGGLPINEQSLENLFNIFSSLNRSSNFLSLESNHITLDGHLEDTSIFAVKKTADAAIDESFAKDVTEFNTPTISARVNGKEISYIADIQTLYDQIYLLDELKYVMDFDEKNLSQKEKNALVESIRSYFKAEDFNDQKAAGEDLLLQLANIEGKQKLFFPILRLASNGTTPPLSDKQVLSLLLKLEDNIQDLDLNKDFDFSDIVIENKKLKNVDLSDALLINAKILNSEIDEVNFEDANLSFVEIKDSKVSNSSFKGAFLDNAEISDSDFLDTNFQFARSVGAKLKNVDLSKSLNSEYLVS
ncbi:MAG: pentapeptide repeat-containing protein [Candidatus Caenarcaniphilales bacterium]|nr:pentapeptide repeat-containing protein [Candidatus Caenarcaniphilales bacterium]